MGERSLFSVVDSVENSGKIKYLKIPAGGKARIRFLYDDPNEMSFSYVHTFSDPFARIACLGKYNNCKWCLQGLKSASFAAIPVFNVDMNELQYWTRSKQYLLDTIYPMLKTYFDQNQSAAGQVFEISRIGSKMTDTKYFFTPIGDFDNQNKAIFGTVEDPYESGMIKEADYDYQPAAQQNNYTPNYNNVNYNTQMYTNPGMSNQPPINNSVYGQNPNINSDYNTVNVPPATRRTVAFE